MRVFCVEKALSFLSQASSELNSDDDLTANFYGDKIKELVEKIKEYMEEEREEGIDCE